MKTSQLMTFVLTFFVFLSTSWSYVLPTDFLLYKVVQKTGRQLVSIDYEVHFKNDKEQIKTFETWFIDGDKNLKVSATGADKYKDSIRISSLYTSKNKIQVSGKVKNNQNIPSDFFQRILFSRNSETLITYLKDQKITFTTKLSRADGRICIALGESSINESSFPMVWVDQDDFLIRKIRLASGAEVSLSDYIKIADDFWLAKKQTLTWAGSTVTILVKGYATKLNNRTQHFLSQDFNQPSELSFVESTPLTQVIEDFYKRFG